MNETEITAAIQKLLEENGYQLEISRTPAHPTFYILDETVKSLVLSTLKFEIAIVKKK